MFFPIAANRKNDMHATYHCFDAWRDIHFHAAIDWSINDTSQSSISKLGVTDSQGYACIDVPEAMASLLASPPNQILVFG